MITNWDIGQIPALQPGSAAIIDQPNSQADTTTVSAGGSSAATADSSANGAGSSGRGSDGNRDQGDGSRPSEAGAESVVTARLAQDGPEGSASDKAENRENSDLVDRYMTVLRDLGEGAQNAGNGAEKGTFAANDVGKLPV